MTNIVVYGAAGHGRVIADMICADLRYNFLGFIDNYECESNYRGRGIIGHELDAETVSKYAIDAVALGIGDNANRIKIAERICSHMKDIKIATLIHPSAVIAATVELGEGSVVFAGAVLQSGAKLGRGCIVNTSASLDHDSEMGDFSALLPGARVAGNVKIGVGAVVCMGACVQNAVTIGNHAVIGAMSLIRGDVPDLAVCYGVPARVTRYRSRQERHL